MKKRVLVYTDCYIYGGSEHLISILINNELINDKFELYFSYRSHKSYNTEVKNNYKNFNNHFPILILTVYPILTTIETLKISNYLKYILKIPFLVIRKSLILELINAITFYFLLRKVKPDILHINNGGFPGADSCNTLPYVAIFFDIKKVIYQINNTIYKSFKLKANIKQIGKYVNHFLVASSDLENDLKFYFEITSDKICRLQNTIKENINLSLTRNDLKSNFNILPDDFLICSVGFLLRSKGHIYLLKAINELKATNFISFSKIKVIIIGNGPEFETLSNFVSTNNLERSIFLLGYRSNVDDYISLSDLFIFPSIADEDMPLVILSAMRYAKIILSTSIAGIKEQIINNDSGILVSPNIESLSKDLKENIINIMGFDYNDLSLNANKRYIKVYSNSIYAESIIDLYNKGSR